MPFPVSFKGTLTVPVAEGPAQVEAVMGGIVAALKKEEARRLVITGSEVRFTGGLFRLVTSANQLAVLTSGRLEFTPEPGAVVIRFRATLTQLLVVVTLMIAAVAYFVAVPSRMLVLMWAWLFGMNYLIARFRFPRFLRTAAWAALDGGAK